MVTRAPFTAAFDPLQRSKMIQTTPSLEDIKQQAKRLRKSLTEAGTAISHSKSLELIAQQLGFRDWNTASAHFGQTPSIGHNAPRGWQIGDQVTGQYLGQPVRGTIISVTTLPQDLWRLTVQFDEAVDVVTSPAFSNMRRRVNCTIHSNGTSPAKTSNGAPQMRLEHLD